MDDIQRQRAINLRRTLVPALDTVVDVYERAGYPAMNLAVHILGYAAKMAVRLQVSRGRWLKSCADIYDDHAGKIS